MLTLRTFKADYAHIVVRHYDDDTAIDKAVDMLIEEHYLHIKYECIRWLNSK